MRLSHKHMLIQLVPYASLFKRCIDMHLLRALPITAADHSAKNLIVCCAAVVGLLWSVTLISNMGFRFPGRPTDYCYWYLCCRMCLLTSA